MTEPVVIVGAGIIGCAIARELASRGINATVIDDRPIAGGATQASAGMLAPHVEAHEGGPLLELGLRSLDLYQPWVFAVMRESGLDVEYRLIGTLEVALTAERAVALRRDGGVRGGWLEPAAVARAYPDLTATAGALTTEHHGYVAAPQLAAALARAAERQGACFERARAIAIVPQADALRVTTSAGVHVTPTVVLAAGAWTNAIQGVRTPPVRPVRGQLLQLEWPWRPLPTIVWGPDCYVVPRLDGSILVGATVEDVGFDERITEEGIGALLTAACDLLPVLKKARVIDARVGLRPATPDGLPAIGPDRGVPGVIHATGHYRNGILLAPITARVIGDFIVDGRIDGCFEAFAPGRFRP